MRIPFAFATLAMLAVLPALAQTESGEQDPPKKIREVYKDVEYIEFDTVILDVEVRKPQNIFITGRGDAKFPSQIDERVHFKRELAKSAGFGIKRAQADETAPK